MSLVDLSKEQKQYLVIGLLGIVIIGGVGFVGIRFSFASVATARAELDELSEKIARADSILSKGVHTAEDFERTVALLKTQIENIPPDQNYYSWATEVIYSTARESGLEIGSIDEIRQPVTKNDVVNSGISFQSYSLRITAHGSYEDTKGFVRGIEKDHPLVRLSGMEISTGSNPDAHEVQLFLQWPFNLGEIVKVWDEVGEKRQAVASMVPPRRLTRDIEAKAEPVKVPEVAEPEPVVVAVAPVPSPVAEPDAKPEPFVNVPEVAEYPHHTHDCALWPGG